MYQNYDLELNCRLAYFCVIVSCTYIFEDLADEFSFYTEFKGDLIPSKDCVF